MKILLFLLVVISLFFPKNILAHSEIQVIEMTSSGFSPFSVTVDENSSVIFVNKDSRPRWPASNVHPTHEIYPEFDPKKPIEPGDSWTFKPKKGGEWKYHDHNFPHLRGVITVIQEGNSDIKNLPSKDNIIVKVKNVISNLFNRIKNLFGSNRKVTKLKPLPNKEEFKKSSYQTQSTILSEIAQSNGAPQAWKFIQDVFKNEGGSAGNIHDLAHLSGILIYENKGFDGIALCSTQFAFGCYHGFLDKAFAKNLDNLLPAQDACLKLSSKKATIEGPVASCIHGIGHGVASFYSTTDLEKALVTCRKLTQGNEYCFDGVFMEFVRSAPDSFFRSDDPYYPCNFLEKKYGYSYSFACGRNQPSLLMGRFKIGYDEVVRVCINSDSKPFKNACFDSLGFSLASTGDTKLIIAGCQKIGADEFVAKCIKAAAGELVFQEVPSWQEKSPQVCNSIQIGQSECHEHIERLIKEYGRKTQINFSPRNPSENINLYTREVLKKCYETDGRDGCYKRAGEALYSQFGLAKTLEVFKRNEQFPEIYARCHEVTHYLSRSEYDRQKSIAMVYAQCDSTCHGGCYHGTLEAYLKEKQNKGGINLNIEFAKVCGKKEDYQKPIEFNECLHGMGHAAMFVTDMELIESLKLCDTISNIEHRERCYTGVFMENSSSSTSRDHKSRFIKATDPFYPCNILEDKYLTICWRYQSSYFAVILHDDWREVSKLCSKIPQNYQTECFRTIGTNQVGFTQNQLVMKTNCELAPSDDLQRACVIGVVSSFAYRFVGDGSKMVHFCTSVSAGDKVDCFKQIGASFSDWTNDKEVAKNECRKIPDRGGRDWCLSVI